MGWGQGIGIGWPNASAQITPVVMGYFQINQACGGDIFDGVTSQLVNTSLYTSGNSIFGTFSGIINYQAVTLGAIVFSPGNAIFEISGPSYTTCPVYYFIDQRCDGETIKNTTTIPVSSGTYNAGEYRYSPALNTIVLIGNEQSTPGDDQQITVTGPNLEMCLVSYDVYDCIQEESYVTGYYGAGTFGSGDRVYTQSGNYGYVSNPVEYQEGDTDTEAFPIGFVDYRCNDCNIYLSPTLNNGYAENYQYYMDLTAIEQLNEVEFASDVNTLTVNVNYSVNFESNEGPAPITRQGEVQFVVPTYFVNAGTSSLLDSMLIFDVPQQDYYIVESNIVVTSIHINDIELGPYDTGWDFKNKYVTNYGNVWTFYYPT